MPTSKTKMCRIQQLSASQHNTSPAHTQAPTHREILARWHRTSDGQIVHITGTGVGGLFQVSSIGFGEQAFVKIEHFRNVADGCKAKINNTQDHNKRPRPSSEIVKEANAMVGKADFNVLWNNCEHFASYLRYGEGSSNQGTIAAVVIGGAALAVGGFLGGVMAGALFLSMKRNRDKQHK
ncbi:Phospholipid-metabolizing enzyme A-C1 [Mizuhopecten yessoensis]|uniref:Phospholipid-metabolizing enzyme A-C1 n=1 Tax=Mizuhopecten yessoensis TaxID=6573 RepID=A0A210PLS2_MIZYE|nr:Phospholipid-metabolizing enzyme A-C1 [Mizuhopecten yessoensis]